MMNVNMDKLYGMLDCENNEKTQKQARALASELKMLSPLFQPIENKGVWENCAIVIAEKSDETLENYLFLLLEWLQDMNWPGAFVILKRLKQYQKVERLTLSVSYSVKKAIASDDSIWLSNIADLLDNQALSTVLSEDCRAILQKHYQL